MITWLPAQVTSLYGEARSVSCGSPRFWSSRVFDLIDGVFLSQLQAQKLRLARNQGPYYGGSLPNVNQIGRTPQDFQVIDCYCTFTLMSLPVSFLMS